MHRCVLYSPSKSNHFAAMHLNIIGNELPRHPTFAYSFIATNLDVNLLVAACRSVALRNYPSQPHDELLIANDSIVVFKYNPSVELNDWDYWAFED